MCILRLAAALLLVVAFSSGQAAAEKRSEYFRARIPAYGEFYERYGPLYRIGALANYWNLRTYDLQLAGRAIEEEYYEHMRARALGPGVRLDPDLETASPLFAVLAWGVGESFMWTHDLHENGFDAYAAPGLTMEQRRQMVEESTDRYLQNPRALSPHPMSMASIEAMPYHGAFARRYPKMIGLMWAGHWYHGGLSEGLIATARDGRDPDEMSGQVLAEFRAKVHDPPTEHPHFTMVAPEFTALHPRAAHIFSNMHMLHDMVGDILADDSVLDKRAAIYQARDLMLASRANASASEGDPHHHEH